jgi:hypothetical protein
MEDISKTRGLIRTMPVTTTSLRLSPLISHDSLEGANVFLPTDFLLLYPQGIYGSL